MTINDSMLKVVFDNDKKTSIGLGVPIKFYKDAKEFIDWRGCFKASINDKSFEMVVTPSTLIIDDSDPMSPVIPMFGNSWVDTDMGKLFVTSYNSSQLNGGFQIFRSEGGIPFVGFEDTKHTHMLVYTDGNNEKEFIPVEINFVGS